MTSFDRAMDEALEPLGRLGASSAAAEVETAQALLARRRIELNLEAARGLATQGKPQAGRPASVSDVSLSQLEARIERRVSAVRGELDVLEATASARLPGERGAGDAERTLVAEHFGRLRQRLERERHALRAELLSAAESREPRLLELEALLGSFLGLVPTQAQGLLAPDVHRSITAEGDERPWYRVDQALTSTRVGALSPHRRDALVERFLSVDADGRAGALESLGSLADAAAETGDPSRLKISAQLFDALAERLGSPELAARAKLAEGASLEVVGDALGATRALAEARDRASTLPAEHPARAPMIAEGLLREAAARGQLAATAPRNERGSHAAAVRSLRLRVEGGHDGLQAAGGVRPTVQLAARLALVELEAYLEANESGEAARVLAHVKATYGDDPRVPWVRASLERFEREAKDPSAVAFLQVALAEANSETLGEALGYGLGGAAAGAVVGAGLGVWFFGVGAGPGAIAGAALGGSLVGGAVGTGALKARNLVRGSSRILEAGRTGLNAQTWKDSVLDATLLAVDVATMGAPVKGLGAVGRGGFTALLGLGTKRMSKDAEALVAGFAARVERSMAATLGPEALARLGRDEAVRLAKELILREMVREGAGFGGKVALSALGAVAASFAGGFYELENSSLTVEQKGEQRRRLWSSMGAAALAVAATGTVFGVTYRAALSPAPGSPAMRAALLDAAPRPPRLLALEPSDFDAAIAARRAELSRRPLLDDETERLLARYDAIARDRVAAFDPVVGDILVNRDALGSPGAEGILAHELSHLRLHGLAPSQLDEVVRAFADHPSWQRIVDECVKANPSLKGAPAAEVVDEAVAMVHGGPRAEDASELAQLVRPILESGASRRHGLHERPVADVERLRATGRLDGSTSPYVDHSGATSLVGHSKAAGFDAREMHALMASSLRGELPRMSDDQLKALQASALRTVLRTFTNAYGNDGPLCAVVAAKLQSFGDYGRGAIFDGTVFKGHSIQGTERNALTFILQTFQWDLDAPLRRRALEKLGEIGRKDDIGPILRVVRRGGDTDLHYGLEAVKAIARRHGPPQRRVRLSEDPELGPLLKKDALTPEERNAAIEAILARGELDKDKTKALKATNLNAVYVVTFKDTLPGPNGTREAVRAIWKPEKTYPGKSRAFYAREVAAYEFDKHFAKTGHVPPTVEGVTSVWPGGPVEVGSLQWMIPNAQGLGLDLKPYMGMLEELRRSGDLGGLRALKGKLVRTYDPKFDELRQSKAYAKQEGEIRTLLYIFSDPDKLPNNVFKNPNLQNLMVDAHDKVWMIDNAWSMGAPGREVSPDILPKDRTGDRVAAKLRTSRRDAIDTHMRQFLSDADAYDVARRAAYVAEELQ